MDFKTWLEKNYHKINKEKFLKDAIGYEMTDEETKKLISQECVSSSLEIAPEGHKCLSNKLSEGEADDELKKIGITKGDACDLCIIQILRKNYLRNFTKEIVRIARERKQQ